MKDTCSTPETCETHVKDKALALVELIHSPVAGLVYSLHKEELLLIPGNFMLLWDITEWSWELLATFLPK